MVAAVATFGLSIYWAYEEERRREEEELELEASNARAGELMARMGRETRYAEDSKIEVRWLPRPIGFYI